MYFFMRCIPLLNAFLFSMLTGTARFDWTEGTPRASWSCGKKILSYDNNILTSSKIILVNSTSPYEYF
jgi:hypothetical protein